MHTSENSTPCSQPTSKSSKLLHLLNCQESKNDLILLSTFLKLQLLPLELVHKKLNAQVMILNYQSQLPTQMFLFLFLLRRLHVHLLLPSMPPFHAINAGCTRMRKNKIAFSYMYGRHTGTVAYKIWLFIPFNPTMSIYCMFTTIPLSRLLIIAKKVSRSSLLFPLPFSLPVPPSFMNISKEIHIPQCNL